MWYHSKSGNAIWIDNTIYFYQSINKIDNIATIYAYIQTPSKIEKYAIEEISLDKDTNISKEFIDWIITFFRMGTGQTNWKDYLEYREKVLPSIKENSTNWDVHLKEKEESEKKKKEEKDGKQLLLFPENNEKVHRKQKILLTCGIVGSGKSTWAKKIVQEKLYNFVIVNRDQIRTMLKSKYTYDLIMEPLVKSIAEYVVTVAIEEGYDIIIDETNLTIEKRKYWLDLIEITTDGDLNDIVINIMYFPEMENNLKNRMQNSRGYSEEYWENIIEGMKKSFEEPKSSEDKRIDEVLKVILTDDRYKYI